MQQSLKPLALSATNQQFIILENSELKEFQKKVKFSFWEKYDENHTVVRFATSWATTKEKISELASLLNGIKG